MKTSKKCNVIKLFQRLASCILKFIRQKCIIVFQQNQKILSIVRSRSKRLPFFLNNLPFSMLKSKYQIQPVADKQEHLKFSLTVGFFLWVNGKHLGVRP